MSLQSEFKAIAQSGGRAAMVTVVEGESLGAKLLVRPDGEAAGTLGSPERDAQGLAHAEELMWAERSAHISSSAR
jgi:xanthine/CO dehydrogenase XdhC/CoxF family maturation factor